MKLENGWSYGTPRRYSVSDAIEREVFDDESGAVESAGRTARNVGSKLAELIELLNDKGVLSDSDVLKMLPGYKVAE